MKIAPTALAVFWTAMVLALAGCAPNAPYRTSYAPFNPNDPDHQAVIESTPAYRLGFVEFDDQGWFWSARQRVAVEQMVRNEAGLGNGSAAAAQPIVLVAFVHGWKNNAEFDSDSVVAFRQILEELNKGEQAAQARGHRSAREVVGVYAGWRGLSAECEPFEELSFWERKDTAHKVGGYGAMTELLVDLENIQKQSLDQLPRSAPRTELIIIGHSFGGAAVYSALSQIINERFLNTVANPIHPTPLKPLGDQVILLNPAFEAQRHYDLNQMAIALKSYPENQRPVLSVFTSESDWATHYAFPVGRFFSTLFNLNRSHEQKMAGLQTIGWFEPFITHHLIYEKNLPARGNVQISTSDPAPTTQGDASPEVLKSFDNVQIQRGKWHPNAFTPQTYHFSHATLKPNDSYRPGDPFFVVSVDPQIMDGHSDITNPRMIRFLREFIEFARVNSKDHSKGDPPSKNPLPNTTLDHPSINP